MGHLFIIAILLPLILFGYCFRQRNGLPTNWPLVGMLPGFLKNIHRLNDFINELLEKSLLSFPFHGPWFTDMHYLLTADPANVNHVASKKFGNFGNGSKINESLEIFGNGISNIDATLWLYHRKVALSFFNHPRFQQFLVNVIFRKIEHGLFPILDHASKHENVIDMQDIFLRFMYDTMCIMVMDHDLKSLSVDLPNFPLKTAIADVEHGMVYRHIVPKFLWKFLRRFNIGYERKIKNAYKRLDNLIYSCIDRKREERKEKASKRHDESYEDEVSADLLTFFMDQDVNNNGSPIRNENDDILKDNIINFFIAGAETTSSTLTWFFCLLSKNPRVLQKIREELKEVKKQGESISIDLNDINNNLIYLHAALCETMRLYPSLVSTTKATIESDILPSGHHVKENTEIICHIYAMGRSKLLWGDDCCDFKPERWITQDGMIKHEPSNKFYVFGSGPRSCLGKQMAFTQIKVIASVMIQHYEIKAVEKYHVPEVAMILRMKSGFKVRVIRT